VCEHKKERDLLLGAEDSYRIDEARSESLALVIGMNGEVIDEEFGTLRCIAGQDIGSATTNNVVDGKDGEVRRMQEVKEMRSRGHGGGVVFEDSVKDVDKLCKHVAIGRSKLAYGYVRGHVVALCAHTTDVHRTSVVLIE